MAATLQRIMLTEALAVAGASGWRSTIKVLQTCIDSRVRPVEEAEDHLNFDLDSIHTLNVPSQSDQ